MSAHTPGPWIASEPNGKGNGWRVGPAWLGERAWSPETAADARLIAAAPEMLEALEKLLEDAYCDCGGCHCRRPSYAARDAADAAIAKAEGAR